MATIELPYFGNIDSSALSDYYDCDIDFNGKKVSVDLNFETESIDSEKLSRVKYMLDNISLYDSKNKIHISDDYINGHGNNVKFYLQHHIEEFDKDTLAHLVDFHNKEISVEEQLLNKLHLVRIGLYPDNEDYFITFDYSIDEEITNYLVVIHTDEKGDLDYMTLES